ncbi:transcription termination factor NusA [Ureaplasma canigenitalium]|uniref:transcription termination factor NusA n=1 Tax=Ureaplasma canigenitalium TaxID=42092 RepID=UPI0004E1BA48|nr:transcription termination factor NusA [Ureaplasma canigenitalium]
MSIFNPADLVELINTVAATNDLPIESVKSIISEAFTKAYLKHRPDTNFTTIVDEKKGTISCYQIYKVVEDERKNDDSLETGYDDFVEKTISEAKMINKDVKIGDELLVPYDISNFERSQVNQIIQYFKQKIAELKNSKILIQWADKLNTIVYGKVIEVMERNNHVSGVKVEFDDDLKSIGFLPSKEMIGTEKLKVNQTYPFYLKELKEGSKSFPIVLSRTDKAVVIEIIKKEVIDVRDGIVQIKLIERIPGVRTKIAVDSINPAIDPVSSIIGFHGAIINNISSQLNNERIDIVKYSSDEKVLIANCIGIDRIKGFIFNNNEEKGYKNVTVIVGQHDLPAIIGRGGSGIKLTAKMTGYNIDVKTEKEARMEGLQYRPFDMKVLKNMQMESINKKNLTNDEMLAVISELKNEVKDLEGEIDKTFSFSKKESDDSNNNTSTSTNTLDDTKEEFEVIEGFEHFITKKED